MEPEPERVPLAEHRRSGDDRSRDRVWVHIVWEVLLAAAVVGAVLGVRAEDAAALRGDSLRDLLVLLAAGILLGSAFALSLRAAVPNLAVGAAAVTAGVLAGWLAADRGYELRTAALVALGAAVALGIALAIVVVGFRAPAWAAGLAAALCLYAAVLSLSAGRSLVLDDAPDLRRWAWPLAAGALLLSAAGGVLGLLPGMRAAVGRYRPAADPGLGRGGSAGFAAAAALVGSTVLAAGAGLVLAMRVRAVVPDDGLLLLAQAAAAALLGGTSAHGRRGGVLGTALAAAFLQLAALWLALVEAEQWTRPALLGGAIGVGLLVGRLVEAAGSRTPPEPELDADDRSPDGEPDDPYATQAWEPYQTGSFTPASSYRAGSDPYWPGQAPADEPGPYRSEPAAPYRSEPGAPYRAEPGAPYRSEPDSPFRTGSEPR
jgi:ribose/xylose/arabinose/galactoside ABC-type transport system permease subunit